MKTGLNAFPLDTLRLRRGNRNRAFTLVEILTVVALLSFIILGLMATFNQTQRAWRTSMTQTDVLEAGRMATDLVARDFVPAAPTFRPGVVNFDIGLGPDPDLSGERFLALPQVYPQDPQQPPESRVSFRQRVFFVTRENKTWRYIGYRVVSPETGQPDSVLGTLYRFEFATNQVDPRNLLWGKFHTNAASLATPVINGVVHFAISAYDSSGVLLTVNRLSALGMYTNGVPAAGNQELFAYETRYRGTNSSGTVISTNVPCWAFLSNAIPAYVDIELGILESRTAEHAQAILNPAVRRQYLEQHLGNVHIFRRRIPLRNVDPEAYQ